MDRTIVQTVTRLLTFRLNREEFSRLDARHLLVGFFCTWAVGIGRWWDDPRASLLQHFGFGSLIYIFALALLLWLVVWPLRPEGWSYFHVVTFVSLTSPPALLYAIPVERWVDVETARSLNVWFLAVVAAWRVALLAFYLRHYAGLAPFAAGVVTLLPVTLIIVALTLLNLERAVFDVMGGLRSERTTNDGAYVVLILLSSFSVLAFVPLLCCYVLLVLDPPRARDDPPGTQAD